MSTPLAQRSWFRWLVPALLMALGIFWFPYGYPAVGAVTLVVGIAALLLQISMSSRR